MDADKAHSCGTGDAERPGAGDNGTSRGTGTSSTISNQGAEVGPPDLPPPFLDAACLPGLVRRLRRLADLSQRELADAADVARTTVARIETGELVPRLETLLRLLAVARLVLVVTDTQGRVVQPMRVWDETRDGADRRFPAHLDLIVDPRGGEWWADVYGLARPPETFHRDRLWREARRRRSQWEVRVQRFRAVPAPPDPDRDPRWRQRSR